MGKKVTNFLRSFAIIALMTLGMIGQAPSGVNAWNECWCGWGNPDSKTWFCRQLVSSGFIAPVLPETSESTCDSACKDVFGKYSNDHHYWHGYGDPQQECIKAHEKMDGWKLDISQEAVPYRSRIL